MIDYTKYVRQEEYIPLSNDDKINKVIQHLRHKGVDSNERLEYNYERFLLFTLSAFMLVGVGIVITRPKSN